MEWKLLNSSLFQVHSSMKPFLCNLCDSKFARISHLNRHTRTHTGERPFDCDRCGKTFARQDKLKVCLRQIFCILANTIVSGGHRRRTKALVPLLPIYCTYTPCTCTIVHCTLQYIVHCTMCTWSTILTKWSCYIEKKSIQLCIVFLKQKML